MKTMIVGLALAALLIAIARSFVRSRAPAVTTSAPLTATSVSASPDTRTEDSCREAVVLTLQSHSGVSALMAPQTLDGQDIPAQDASEAEGRFATPCYQPDGISPPEGAPHAVKICRPTSFVLHVSGHGKGVFDLQAKPFPEVAHPVSPLLLCNYMLDNDRAYDWVLKYQTGSRPAVWLLGSKDDPNPRP